MTTEPWLEFSRWRALPVRDGHWRVVDERGTPEPHDACPDGLYGTGHRQAQRRADFLNHEEQMRYIRDQERARAASCD